MEICNHSNSEGDDDYEDFFDPELFVDKDYTQKNVCIGDVQLELYALHNASSTDHDLTGQIVWPAAKILALYLQEHVDLLHSQRILEVGAGIGLGGFVATKLVKDASKVVLTDHIDTVLDVLQRNANLNFSHQLDKPHCAYLSWGSDLHLFRHTYGTFDVIIGADVVFWPEACEPLFQTLDYLLDEKESSIVIISYICRNKYSEKLMYSIADKYSFKFNKVDLTKSVYYQDLLEAQGNQNGEIIIFSRKQFSLSST